MRRLRNLPETIASLEIYFVIAVVVLTIAAPRFLPLAVAVVIIFGLNRIVLGLLNGRSEGVSAWALGTPFAMLLAFMLVVTSLVTAFPEVTHPQVMRVVTGLGLYFALIRWLAFAPAGRAEMRWRTIAFALCALLLVLVLAGPFIVSWQGSKFPFIPASLYASFSLMVSDSVNPNVLAGALILFIPVVLAWLLFPLGAGRWFAALRALAGVAMVAGVAMLVLTQSRGAFVGLCLACAALLMLRWPRLAFPLSGLVGVGALFVALRPDASAALTDAVGDTVTNGLPYRVEIWSRGWFMMQDFMFTGIGMGAFAQVTELLYPLIITPPGVPHAHNLLLQIAVDLGVPGLIAWLGILGTVVVACWRAYCCSADSTLRALGAGLLASQVALLGHGLTDAVTWGMVRSAPLVWLLWGVAVACGLTAQRLDQTRPIRSKPIKIVALIQRRMRLRLGFCDLAPLGAGLALLLAVQLAAASSKDFWEDETFNAIIGRSGLPAALYAEPALHPPLHFAISAAWFAVVGEDEFALRVSSVVFAALTLIIGYALAVHMFGLRTAVVFAFLMPLAPLFVIYGSTFRYYAAASVTALGVVYCICAYFQTRRVHWLGLYVVLASLFLYLVYTALVVILACWLVWLMWWWTQAGKRKLLVHWIAVHALIAIAYLPWAAFLVEAIGAQVQSAAGAGGLADRLTEAVKRTAFLAYGFSAGETLSPLNPVAWVGLAVVAALSLTPILARRLTSAARMLAMFLLIAGVSMILTTGIGARLPAPQSITNRSLYLLPFFVLWLSFCITSIISIPSRWGWLLGSALAGALVGVYLVALVNYFHNREFMKPFLIVPWNGIMQAVRAAAPTLHDSALICNEVDSACAYYGRRYGFEPRVPQDGPALAAQRVPHIWWVNSNVVTRPSEDHRNIFEQMRARYAGFEQHDFALHDPSVRDFKARILSDDVYEYRVNVWHFSRPVQP